MTPNKQVMAVCLKVQKTLVSNLSVLKEALKRLSGTLKLSLLTHSPHHVVAVWCWRALVMTGVMEWEYPDAGAVASS